MEHDSLIFSVWKQRYAVSKLPPEKALPDWAASGKFVSLTRTPEELSVVCEQGVVPEHVTAERDWRLLQIAAVLDFSLVGILAVVSGLLAEAAISIFVVSTFNTDYLLVKEGDLEKAVAVLRQAGHQVLIAAE